MMVTGASTRTPGKGPYSDSPLREPSSQGVLSASSSGKGLLSPGGDQRMVPSRRSVRYSQYWGNIGLILGYIGVILR